MTGDPLHRVRAGDPLKIPAAAYNAFVETAVAHRSGQRNTAADAHRELNRSGVVLVRNDAGVEIPAHHALAITGVLIEPDANDHERAFQSRTPVTGGLAHAGSPPLAFVVAQRPIEPGKLGLCVISGTTAARIHVLATSDATCELRAGETALVSSPIGGAPILWKEPGTGERWAVIELGRPSVGRLTAVLGPAEPIPTEANRWRYRWTQAVLDGDAGSETYLRYIPLPSGIGSGNDPDRMAINRFEAHHCDDPVPGAGFEGLLGVGPVCDLPGVPPECQPARSLDARLAPVPEGVTAELACERDSLGNPVWVFEAMPCAQFVDPGDGDRQFTLLAKGGEG